MGLRVSYENLKPVITTVVGVGVCVRARARCPLPVVVHSNRARFRILVPGL